MGDKITCYYHQDDFYGTKGMKLYCLQKPSSLQQEMFTVIIAGCILALALILNCIFAFWRYDDRRQARLAIEEQEAKEAELAEAKKRIEEREMQEAQKQAELLQKQWEDDFNDDVDSLAGSDKTDAAEV